MKRAILIVNTDHVYCEANILLDEGTRRSFITYALANQRGVPLLKSESISLAAFGAQTSASRQLPVTVINVVTFHGEKIALRFPVVDKIATPLKANFRHQIQDIQHLRGLKLAHPITSDDNFDISLLNGADHYRDIVEDTIIRLR